MPTATGGETIGERLTRLRTELVRVRGTIARHENNGATTSIAGDAVTEIAYERALARQAELEARILNLENRLTGSSGRAGIAVTKTMMDS